MVSMVIFAENTEHYVKTSPRARGQDRSCTLSALRCSKLSPHAALRERATQKDAQLGSCSRDPIGFEGSQWNLNEYVNGAPTNRFDPYGKWGIGVYDGDGVVCGYSIFLLTGSWCSDPEVILGATDGYDDYISCWWNCEVTTHSTVCGKLLVATEVVSGAVSLPGVTIPKLPGQVVNPLDLNRGLLRALARKFGMRRAELMIRQLSRNGKLMGAAKGGVVATALIEAGISINCGISCGPPVSHWTF